MAPRFRILGPVGIWADGEPLPIGGAKQRALFTLLATRANETVTTDTLIDALWGERPPTTARTALQGYVSNLRRVLEPDRALRSAGAVLVTSGPGYTLSVRPGELDREVFEALVQQARDARDAGRPAESAELFGSALALWRGPALADVAYEPWAAPEAARLEELRLVCAEDRIDVELQLGREGELVPELQSLVAAHPLRERLRGLLILALYRAGRQAEALEAYQETRRALVEGLGIDPSPALRRLEASILRQEEALAGPSEGAKAAVPRRASVPRPPSTLVGRTRELDEVSELLRQSDVRLVTLTGPGGTGKTRLALEVASRALVACPGGVWWSEAEALRDPAAVLPLIGATVEGEGELRDRLSGRALVVVDNLEQVLEAGPALVRLLEDTPDLTLLVTSRERLHVTGEHEYGVPPLAENEAVALFVERARAVRPAFDDDGIVAEICRRVDCLPLGVELSAARVNVLDPRAILERLGRRLSLLTTGSRDVPERQRTLRAAIEWSHELLDDDEATLFGRLAVFADGFTIEAAEEVCGAELDTLASLVDKSLVRRDGDRFSMLGSIHEYARELLDASDEASTLGRAHFDWYLALVRQLAEETGGATTPDSVIRLTLERENLRLALRRAVELDGAVPALELAVELRRSRLLAAAGAARGRPDPAREGARSRPRRSAVAPCPGAVRGRGAGRDAGRRARGGRPCSGPARGRPQRRGSDGCRPFAGDAHESRRRARRRAHRGEAERGGRHDRLGDGRRTGTPERAQLEGGR